MYQNDIESFETNSMRFHVHIDKKNMDKFYDTTPLAIICELNSK